MVKTTRRCTMTSILFYIFVFNYYARFFWQHNFNPVGNEFTSIVIIGLLIIISKNNGVHK